jgi:hypothetical protein
MGGIQTENLSAVNRATENLLFAALRNYSDLWIGQNITMGGYFGAVLAHLAQCRNLVHKNITRTSVPTLRPAWEVFL